MKGSKNPTLILIPLIVLLGLYLFRDREASDSRPEAFRVIEVVDGDTIRIGDGQDSLVRYIGIDTPESGLQDSPGDPLAEEAERLNRDLVGDKEVRLEYDEEKYDVYGRKLAYVYSDGVFVNAELVREGLGIPFFIDPNTLRAEEIKEAADEAQKAKRGLWGDLTSIRRDAGNEEYLVDKSVAARFHGKRVLVRGQITETDESDRVISLRMGDDFEIVIFKDALPNFEYFGIDPLDYYTGKIVEVTGRIKIHRGTPGITVKHPILVRIIE